MVFQGECNMRNKERTKRALKKSRIPFWQQPNECLVHNCLKRFVLQNTETGVLALGLSPVF